ncbi:putative odorant receptor 92a [Lucilia sericata]|uniref:putative odorant receptor 92a n=1 Tax=Lucilia sericata TaxID=13632 RepID=UPI0018A857CA|nr:putative odorant receptor 92a [Lucilia sericata]
MVLDKTIPHIGEFTKIPINLLFVLGFCVMRWKPSEKPRWLQILLVGILIFHLVVDIMGMLAYLIFESLDTSLEKTAYIIYSAFAGNSLMKLVCCFFNLQKLHRGLKILEKYYPRTLLEREDYKLDEHLRTIRKYNGTLTIYHFAVTSMFNWFPLIQTIILYYRNGNSDFLYALPFPMVYLFNVNTVVGYTFAYVTQCTGSYSASCIFLGSDLLLITCVHLINMNFKYLAKSIREFKPTGALSDIEKLKGFMVYHNDILNTVKLIDDTFNISIFLNYMGTVTIICLIGFQLVAGTDFLDLIKFLSFLISVLTHVYFISTFGTEMMGLSSAISDAFMHHPWYDAHIQYQRALTMPIARGQRPAHLNAFKFFIISMETFKSLVSISYQFFTLIKTRYDEE